MQAAIYVQISNEIGYNYEKPIINVLKEHLPGLILYDFDTHSDRMVAGYAMELLEKADKVVVVIEANESPATGLVTFLEKVLTHQNKCIVLLYGQNLIVERMLKLLDKDKLVRVEQIETSLEQATQFLSAEQA